MVEFTITKQAGCFWASLVLLIPSHVRLLGVHCDPVCFLAEKKIHLNDFFMKSFLTFVQVIRKQI